MKDYKIKLLKEELSKIFDHQSADQALSWMISAENRRPVIVVGAGFSKNAVWKDTEESARNAIPLWDEVTKAFREDLRLQPEKNYDDLLLADLYKPECGPPTYHQKLLDLLPDEKIKPGPAHNALFDFNRFEAVITTNQLDTLLDKPVTFPEEERRWHRVIKDSQLGLSDAEWRTQLLYLHGHRSDFDSWIFSRSDYEDLDRTRPVMMRRVRQLFAQHPILFVGFSLTDPNFHSIVRQIGMEMNGNQPLGLAIMVDEEPQAFINYWQQKGIKISTFSKDTTDFPSFFSSLGEIVRDRRPNVSSLSPDKVFQDIQKIHLFKDRLSFAKKLLQEISDTGQELHDREEIHDKLAFKFWREVALPDEEPDRRMVKTGSNYVERGECGENHWLSLSMEMRKTIEKDKLTPYLTWLNDEQRFNKSNFFARAIDYNKRTNRATLKEIIEWLEVWFEFAINKNIEPSSYITNHLEQFLNSFSFIWRILIVPSESSSKKNTDLLAQSNAKYFIHRCFQLAQKYGLDEKYILEDASFLKLEPFENSTPNVQIENLKLGTQSSFDGDAKKAFRYYVDAREDAKKNNNLWHEWLALDGMIKSDHQLYDRFYYSKTKKKDNGEPTEQTRQAWRNRRKKLETLPPTKRWIERTTNRQQRVLAEGIQSFVLEQQQKLWENQTIRMSNSARDLWRSWRDLEESHAHPWQQARLIQVLIDSNSFEDALSELKFRIEFGIEKSDKWLKTLGLKKYPSGEERQKRDEKLVNEILNFDSPEKTNTQTLARLEMLPGVGYLIQINQVAQLKTFLDFCFKKLYPSVSTYRYTGSVSRQLMRGVQLYGKHISTKDGIEHYRTLVNKVSETLKKHDGYDFITTLGNTFWFRWTKIIAAKDILEIAIDWTNRFSHLSDQAYIISCKAFYLLVANGQKIPKEHHQTMTEHAQLLAKAKGSFHSSIKFYALQVMLMQNKEEAKVIEIAKLAYPKVFATETKAKELPNKLEQIAQLLQCYLDRNKTTKASLRYYKILVEYLLDANTNIKAWNKYESYEIGTAIGKAFTVRKPNWTKESDKIKRIVLDICSHNHDFLSGFGPSLIPELWGEYWEKLCDILIGYSFPPASQDSSKRKLALIEIVYNYFDTQKKEEPCPPEFVQILLNITTSIADDHGLTAHIAAFVIEKAIRNKNVLANDLLRKNLELALNRVAEDPRPLVRAAAALACVEFKKSKESAIKEIGKKLTKKLENDNYAFTAGYRR